MSTSFGRGLHAAPGSAVIFSAYDRYLGRWSRLSVPDLLAAAKAAQACRVLDVASGTGEAASLAIPIVGNAGFVVGADISLEMVTSARARLDDPLYWPVNADGQALPFTDGAFDAVICQLGLQFFPNNAAGLSEFRRVVRVGGTVAVCVCANIGSAAPVGQSGRRDGSISYKRAAQRPRHVMVARRSNAAGGVVQRCGLPKHPCGTDQA